MDKAFSDNHQLPIERHLFFNFINRARYMLPSIREYILIIATSPIIIKVSIFGDAYTYS